MRRGATVLLKVLCYKFAVAPTGLTYFTRVRQIPATIRLRNQGFNRLDYFKLIGHNAEDFSLWAIR